MWGIIGGSGFEKSESFRVIEVLDRSTPFGDASTGLKRGQIGNEEVVFLPRHGENHEKLPSEVNYRANIYSLKRYGVDKIISTSAVGSLKREYKPGDLVVPSQYIDRTKSIRNHTFAGNGFASHISLAKPISKELTGLVLNLQDNFDFDLHFNGVYICIEGPYFSTQAESLSYIAMGAGIIGMTGFPEYALAREAGIHYLPCCFVTDYDCWDDSIEHVTVEIVVQTMKNNNVKAYKLIESLVNNKKASQIKSCVGKGIASGLMTQNGSIPVDSKDLISFLGK